MMSKFEVLEIADNYDYFMTKTDREYRETTRHIPEEGRFANIMVSFSNRGLIQQDIEYIEEGLAQGVYSPNEAAFAEQLLDDMRDVMEFYAGQQSDGIALMSARTYVFGPGEQIACPNCGRPVTDIEYNEVTAEKEVLTCTCHYCRCDFYADRMLSRNPSAKNRNLARKATKTTHASNSTAKARGTAKKRPQIKTRKVKRC